MKLEGIDSQERARELTGCDVYFPRALAPSDDEAMSWAEIIGFTIVDAATGRQAGRIATVDDSTLNILFCLEDGTLIPAPEELITDVDRQARTITIKLPQGLLDINK
jgi:16S rRNA processing protein RimM